MRWRPLVELSASAWAGASAAALIAAGVAPWEQGRPSWYSVPSHEGGFVIVFSIGVASMLLLVAAARRLSRGPVWTIAALSAIAVAVAAVEWMDLATKKPGLGFTSAEPDAAPLPLTATAGWGLELAVAASVSLLLASLVLATVMTPRDREESGTGRFAALLVCVLACPAALVLLVYFSGSTDASALNRLSASDRLVRSTGLVYGPTLAALVAYAGLVIGSAPGRWPRYVLLAPVAMAIGLATLVIASLMLATNRYFPFGS